MFSCLPVACATRRRQTGDHGRVRYIIRGGLGRAGLCGWPLVEGSLVGDVGRHGMAQEISFLYERSTGFIISKKKLCHSRG